MLKYDMALSLRPLTAAQARAIAGWRYEAPYDFYNMGAEAVDECVRYLSDPLNAFYSLMDERESLAGFCSFGPDGQVAGGDYSLEALDIGLGLRPDLTGRGQGAGYAVAALDFARSEFAPRLFRVTIAEFNQRAQRVWQKLGFGSAQRFQRTRDGVPFVILVREA